MAGGSRERISTGKISPDLLEKYVFTRLGVDDKSIVIGPSYGEDAAIIKIDSGIVLVVHSDPITAAEKLIGWLSVHIACNDIAVRGARPRWLLSVLLLPEEASVELLDEITRQIDSAAREVGVSIVGGHTESAPDLSRPIVSTTAIGIAREDRVVSTRNAKPGDLLVMTKYAGLEGTAILASDFREELLEKGVSVEVLGEAEDYTKSISVVPEAVALAEEGLVSAMHDPTEGGILGGVAELAYASGTLIRVYEEKIPLTSATRTITSALGVDPLKLISSGVLLATTPKKYVDRVLDVVERLGVRASIIGEVVSKYYPGRVVYVKKSGETIDIPRHVVDEIYRVYSRE